MPASSSSAISSPASPNPQSYRGLQQLPIFSPLPPTNEILNVSATREVLNDYHAQMGNYPSTLDYLTNAPLRNFIILLIIEIINFNLNKMYPPPKKSSPKPMIKSLPHESIVELLVASGDFRNVKIDDSGNSEMLYMRIEYGPDQGIFKYQSCGDSARNYGWTIDLASWILQEKS